MNDDPAILDGNAAAGALQALLLFDSSSLLLHCGNCAAIRPLASLAYFGTPRAFVLRCRSCGAPNLRLLETPSGTHIDLSGAARIDSPAPAQAAGQTDSQQEALWPT